MHLVLKFLFSNKARILLNIIVWLFIFRAGWHNNNVYEPPQGTKTGWVFHLHFILYNLLFVAVVYINTLWLVPRYLSRRQYVLYIPLLTLSIILFTFCQSIYAQYLLDTYPGTDLLNFTSVALELQGNNEWWVIYFRTLPSILLFVVFSTVWRLAAQLLKVNRQNERIQQQQTQAELDLLKSQINPHFLFNVLNSIYSLSLKKSDKTPAVVLQLSEILRYMLYETGQSFVSLEKEVAVLKDYIDIEKIRINHSNNIQLDTDIDNYSYRIAPAIMITFVENAIKHGIDSMSGNAYVHITIKAEHHILYLSCRNNYKKKHGQQGNGGIGITNVKKRLQLLYPNAYTLNIDDDNEVFTISLMLNMQP